MQFLDKIHTVFTAALRQVIIYSKTNSYYLLLYGVITYSKLFAVNYSTINSILI